MEMKDTKIDQTNGATAPSIQRMTSKDIEKMKADDIIERYMEKILKIK